MKCEVVGAWLPILALVVAIVVVIVRRKFWKDGP